MPRSQRTAEVARRLVDAYVTSLRQRLPTYCIEQLDKLPGAAENQLLRLRQCYPGAPTELVYLLQRVNGTSWETLSPSCRPSTGAGVFTDVKAAAAAAVDLSAAKPTADTPPSLVKSNGVTVSGNVSSGKSSSCAYGMTGGSTKPRRPPQCVALPILGSAYTSCPYYLKSIEQMLLAEQQFPPPSTTLPAEGDGWRPPAPQASDEKSAAAQAAGRRLNKNSIASVYQGYRIVHETVPGSVMEKATIQATTIADSAAAAAAGVQTKDAGAVENNKKTVYVDPRIDINAKFYHWLVFADSMQPHVRDSAAKVTEADPAKMAAAAEATPDPHTPKPMSSDPTNMKDSAATSTNAAAVALTVSKEEEPHMFAASRLYVDFKPAEEQGGTYGQVIQFRHGRPASFSVIANDFGGYLKYVMAEEYPFTLELEADENDADEEVEDALVNGNGGEASTESDARADGATSPTASTTAASEGEAANATATKTSAPTPSAESTPAAPKA